MRIYGPVPSRRFGLSLGVDLVPRKTCSFDCIYCQVGVTDTLTSRLEDFYSVDEIVADVEEALEDGPSPDLITFAGSGEPTLYKSLGELIDRLHAQFDIPILLITNSSLFWKKEVADAVCKADILAPSLDAGDASTYAKLNQPHVDITFEKLVKGLEEVTHRFEGEIRLEVMLVRDVNDSQESLMAIAKQLEKLRFDQIDVNTPVRPPIPERGALPCYQETFEKALEIFGEKASAIGKFEERKKGNGKKVRSFSDMDKDIRETLLRRPCTANDISKAMDLPLDLVVESLERLTASGLIRTTSSERDAYYHVRGAEPTGSKE